MPTSTIEEKAKMCQQYQNSRIKVFIHGNDMLEAHNLALHIAKTKDLFYIDGYSFYNFI